jgi:hypothetical protein
MTGSAIEAIPRLPDIPEPEKGIPLERAKGLVDFLKHVATLSTATLLLTATMADRLFAGATNRSLLVIPLVLAGGSLAISLVIHIGAIGLIDRPILQKGAFDRVAIWAATAITFFLASLLFVGWFAIQNFPA